MKDKNLVCKHCNKKITKDYGEDRYVHAENYLYYCDISRKTHAEPIQCKEGDK